MMSSTETATLALIGRAIFKLGETGEPGLTRVADALALTTGQGIPFDAALGLSAGWHRRAQLARRDQLLREMAAQYFPRLGGRGAAAAITRAAASYTPTFDHDRKAKRRPSGVNGYVFDIMCIDAVPGEARIRQILSEALANN